MDLDLKFAIISVKKALINLEVDFDQLIFAQYALEDLENAKHHIEAFLAKTIKKINDQIIEDEINGTNESHKRPFI